MPRPASPPPPCTVAGCTTPVTKPGHTLCYPHWKAQRDGKLSTCAKCDQLHPGDLCPSRDDSADAAGPASLTSTKLGQRYDLSPQRMNLVLAELGWLEKYVKGWTPTDQGNRLGAELRTSRKGVPYAVWPESITDHKAFRNAVEELTGPPAPEIEPEPESDTGAAAPTSAASNPDFRQKFPPTLRTQDGHMVRSRGEVIIDDYLYQNRIVHAYERRLPIEQDVLCDFYLPQAKVYIEYWGLENQPKYAERMKTKKAIYAAHDFRLIDLHDTDIERLDDTLPPKLLAFGIDCA
jgi:hypothetical protein